RTPGFRPRTAPIAAVDACDRRAAAGLRPCAAGCRHGLRSAGRIADVTGAGGRSARSVDGAGRARADVRPTQGGRLLRSDDAEQAVPEFTRGRAGPARRGGVIGFVGWEKRSVPTIVHHAGDGGYGAVAPLPLRLFS